VFILTPVITAASSDLPCNHLSGREVFFFWWWDCRGYWQCSTSAYGHSSSAAFQMHVVYRRWYLTGEFWFWLPWFKKQLRRIRRPNTNL